MSIQYTVQRLSFLIVSFWFCVACGNQQGEQPKPAVDPQKNRSERGAEPQLLKDYLPTQAMGDQLIPHEYFSISYCTKNKNAEWVAYELNSWRVNAEKAERRHNFKQDPVWDQTARDADYSHSGYDRGHLVPAEDMDFSEIAMDESFYLSNISPQVPGFNRGVWKKLEHRVRNWALEHQHIYVITGPVLRKRLPKNQTIGEGVEVPRAFYKVILDYQGQEGIAFLLDNEASDRDLRDFACAIEVIEQQTGINFFPSLSEEESDLMEKRFDLAHWKIEED